MGGFFSVRLAPGLRISASSRGMRAHLGPRAARVHVGGGGTGVSTGAGPFTLYQSVGGRPRGGSYYDGPTRQQVASTAKEQQAQVIGQALQAIGSIHRESFSAPVKTVAALPALPAYPVVLDAFLKQERRGVRWSDRDGRKAARVRAREHADAYALELQRQAYADQAGRAARIDEDWRRLHDNDPVIVLEALATAFADNQAPVAPVGVEKATAFLVVLVPDEKFIPDREPGTTAAGNLSLAKMSKGRAAWWYRELVAGHIVVSVREAFAVAPGLQAASIVAVRDGGRSLVGRRRCEPLLAVTLTREQLARVPWDLAGAWDVVRGGSDLVVNPAPKTEALRPIDLSSEPDLERLTEKVEFDRD